MRIGRLAPAIAAWILLAGASSRDLPRIPPPGQAPDTAPIRRIGAAPYVAVNDLARLLDATKFWRADVRKLVLRAGRHSISLTVDNPFVLVDERTLRLGSPVRSLRGELQIPAALIDSLPADSSLARLYVDSRRDRIVLLPASGRIGSPVVTAIGGGTRIAFPADRPEEAVIVARSRAHFRLRLGGLFTGILPEGTADRLMRGIRAIPSASGSAFEVAVSPEARAFRMTPDASGGRVVLDLLRESIPGSESFAPEGPAGPRTVRVIVLDPGHGGSDPGVIAGSAVEKDLTLALARMLAAELEHRLPAHVVLTRDGDRSLPAEKRAEVANRARADLVLSLHFDAYPAAQARGATAYCPSATYFAGDGAPERGRGASAAPLVPWREVAVRHAVQSRSLAEAILSALELRGEGPTRLRERLPYPLVGVNAPGLMLECAALTSPGDRERVQNEAGLRELAATIAEGIVAWQRNE
jgi:N-acetylmuramoyl-L-alanine amidase